jgi:hypothetical protein
VARLRPHPGADPVVDPDAGLAERIVALQDVARHHLHSDPPLKQAEPTHPLVVFAVRWERIGGFDAYRRAHMGRADSDDARLAEHAERWATELGLAETLAYAIECRRGRRPRH